MVYYETAFDILVSIIFINDNFFSQRSAIYFTNNNYKYSD